MFRLNRRDEPPDPPDGDDTRFKESLARLSAELTARNPLPATGVPPLRSAPKAPPAKPLAPQDIIRDVVRERATEPAVARRAVPPAPPPPSPPSRPAPVPPEMEIGRAHV